MGTPETEWQDTEPQAATERAKEEASRVGDAVQREAGEVLDEAKAQTQQILTEAKSRLREEAKRQSGHTAQNLRGLATDVHTMVDSAESTQSPVACG